MWNNYDTNTHWVVLSPWFRVRQTYGQKSSIFHRGKSGNPTLITDNIQNVYYEHQPCVGEIKQYHF